MSCSGSDGPRQPSEEASLAGRARAAYDACVNRSAAAILAHTGNRNIDGVAEQAFLACSTEEGVLRAIMLNVEASPIQIETMIIKIKGDNKRRIRGIWEAAGRKG